MRISMISEHANPCPFSATWTQVENVYVAHLTQERGPTCS